MLNDSILKIKLKSLGFTLMEVMIAIAIIGTIVSMIWISINRAITVREQTMAVNERYQGVRLALNRIAGELSMAFLVKHQFWDKRVKTMFKGIGENPASRLTFTSFSHQRLFTDVNESDQNVITYYGDADPDDPNKTNLYRREKVRIGTENENLNTDKSSKYILTEDINEFKLEYWDEKQKEWLSDWDSTQVEKADRLPSLVKIELIVNDPFGEEITFVTKTRIALTSPLKFNKGGI